MKDSGFVRPMVAGTVSNRGVWIFAIALAAVSVALFFALETRRLANDVAMHKEPSDQAEPTIAPAATLVIPPEQPAYADPAPGFSAARAPDAALLLPTYVDRRPSLRAPNPDYSAGSRPRPSREQGYDNPFAAGLGRVPDQPYPQPAGAAIAPATISVTGSAPAAGSERVQASRFANPATTVPKGTVIQAVLESALDSTRPGLARAIISRDVYSFDGSRVLIQKGSRLIGEYKADLAPGQKRALIQWQRLIRPDGVLINLDSPSADPLGRAGVEGKVNSHFLTRFGGAILQSALNIGTQVANSELSNGSTIIALPGAFPGQGNGTGTGLVGQEKVQPTVTVKQGTSVSVFVARDLDFTSVE